MSVLRGDGRREERRGDRSLTMRETTCLLGREGGGGGVERRSGEEECGNDEKWRQRTEMKNGHE